MLTTSTFDSRQMNWTVFGEFALAVLVPQTDVFNRLLGTTPLTPGLWEAGKAVARGRGRREIVPHG